MKRTIVKSAKSIRPAHNLIVTTGWVYDDAVANALGEVIKSASKINKGFMAIQRVLAIGPNVREIKVGDLVSISFKRFAKIENDPTTVTTGLIRPRTTYYIPTVELDGKECILCGENDVEYTVETEGAELIEID